MNQETFFLTKTKSDADLEKCPKCDSPHWHLRRHELHGHSVRCASCDFFLKWAGKSKRKVEE